MEKEEMVGMLLTEFADERNVKADTVAAFIRSNAEQFEGLTEMRGKKKFLSEAAIEILDKQYPTPVMVQIVQDPDLVKSYMAKTEEVDRIRNKYEDLLEELAEQTNQLAQAQAKILQIEARTEAAAEEKAQKRIQQAIVETKTRAEYEMNLIIDERDTAIKGLQREIEALKESHEREIKLKDEAYLKEMTLKTEAHQKELDAKSQEIERNKARGLMDRLKNRWL